MTAMTAESEVPQLAPILSDLGIEEFALRSSTSAAGEPGDLWCAAGTGQPPHGDACLSEIEGRLGEESALLLGVPGRPDDRALASWRNALWPRVHVFALYRCDAGKATRQTLQGRQPLEGHTDFEGVILAGRRRELVMSPAATVAKFDTNAKGWDGQPGSPGYAHFRWMRRYVGLFADIPDGARILDFGCGAGWVGIEAARRSRGSSLAAFDPSPEMVRIAEANARASGIEDFTGRTGFGEVPPFPAPGEAPYDHVLSSGVVSFSPDVERWVEGLAASVAAGGTLVIGDIHRDARGFRSRRRTKPLLPVRELNSRTREELIERLSGHGFRLVRTAGYQLTYPIPEAMHVSERKLKGLLSPPLLWLNQLATFLDRSLGSPAQNQFDSWVAHLVKDR